MNTNIVVKNRVTSTVTTDTFELEVDGRKLVYIDYLNDKGKVIDFNLRDDNGYELTDDGSPDNNAAETMGRIQEYLDEIEALPHSPNWKANQSLAKKANLD